MKHWSLRKLLTLGFAAPLVMIGVLVGVFFYSLGSIDRQVDQISEDNIPGLMAVNQAMEQTLTYRVLTMQHIVSVDPAVMKAIDEKCDALAGNIAAALGRYEKTINTDEDRALFAKIAPALESYRTTAKHVRSLSAAGQQAEAEVAAKNAALVYDAFAKSIDDLLTFNETSAGQSVAAITSTMSHTRRTVTFFSLAAIGFAVAGGFLITRQVNLTIRRVSNALDDTSAQVTAAASQVSGASQSLAQGASEQAASLEETSASIEELSSMTRRNAESAQQTKELSNQTRVAADTCAADMQAMNIAMGEIKTSSSDISKIIKTIDEIAFQTNILALNAAVEAARAGEAGMGFAVVAEEVRSLAQRSAQSAKETAAKIEVAISKSEHGVRISGKVAESLAQILEKARKADVLIAEIATASHEQNQGIGQVNTTVSQMDKVTQSNAGNAEETAAAAEELSAQAVAMQEVVADLRRLIDGRESAPKNTVPEKRLARAPKFAATLNPSSKQGALRRPKLNDPDPLPTDAADLHFADVAPGVHDHSRSR